MLSIIIPNYNYKHYLEQCLNSLKDQGSLPIQIIIIDDASTDGSKEYITEVGRLNNNVDIILKETNTGLVNTIRLGCATADCKYLYVLSADDYVLPNSLDKVIAKMEQYKAKLAQFNGKIDRDGKTIADLVMQRTDRLFRQSPDKIIEDLYRLGPPSLYTWGIFTKEHYESFGGIPDSATGDWPAFDVALFKGLKDEEFLYLPSTYVHCYRAHAASYSSSIEAHLERKLADVERFVPEKYKNECLMNLWLKQLGIYKSRGMAERAIEAQEKYNYHKEQCNI